MHFMECKFSQDGQNSWHMRHFLAPKCLILAPFSYPKIIFRRNFTTILPFLAHLSRPSSVRPSVNFHIFDFFSRAALWILMKLGRDEVLMVPYKCCCFSARSAQRRIQGRAKIGHGGSPSSRIFFSRPEGYSNKPNA